MIDEIRCDADGCRAVIRVAGSLTQERSVQWALDYGWQSWMGSMRAYHRCARHVCEYQPLPVSGGHAASAGVPAAASAADPGSQTPGREYGAAGRILEAPVERTPEAMPNPHTTSCCDASCGLATGDEVRK